jgi:Chaperone for flagella basal body P-ring formation
MKTNGAMIFLSFALVAGILCGSAARAARDPRIELLREIHVAGTSVLLSDLLPEGASLALRKQASEITLGAAPKPGNTRTLEKSAVESRIGVETGVLSGIVVPARVVVSGEARAIALPEVFDAICRSLRENSASDCAALRPEDIQLQTQVLVGPGDAGLQVLRADMDAGLGRARFLLWPSKDPKVLPFIVTAKLEQGAAIVPARRGEWISGSANPGAPAFRPIKPARPEILVSPGQEATLVLHSDVLRMIADVMPLERGSLGQRIRVRMTDTGKIFRAQVDGRAHLDLKF